MTRHGNRGRSGDGNDPWLRRRSVLRRAGGGFAVIAGASIAGCSGDDGSSDSGSDADGSSTTTSSSGASTGSTSSGGGETGGSGDESGGSDGGSSDGGLGTPDVDSSALQVEIDSWAEYGFETADVEGEITNEIDGLEVSETVTMTGTDTAGTERFAVFLAMENVGEERTAVHRYGYHLSAYDGNDQLLTDDSRQSSNRPPFRPGEVSALKVDVGFVDADDGGPAPADVARYEMTIDCTTAGGGNPSADGTYCG